MTKFWVGVVSKEHVQRGIKGVFCQVCHGKKGPLNRMKKGDYLLYYSPKYQMADQEKLQAFTAVGKIVDDSAYQVEMFEDFFPFRRNVSYYQPALNKSGCIPNGVNTLLNYAMDILKFQNHFSSISLNK